MMRNDINMALVSMVRAENQSAVNASNASDTKVRINSDGEFNWSSMVQSVIMGSFFAFYVLSQVSELGKINFYQRQQTFNSY